MLGIIYFEDEQLRNYKAAQKHCLTGAENGYGYCQYLLGKMYYDGLGTPKDLQQALYWMRKSAGQRMPQAIDWLDKHEYTK